ncbi:MAG: membrane assembly protein AsmA [Bacteroidia bacterium]|nr:membrane assembly protein AsmA [Bacteroidia bacterium]
MNTEKPKKSLFKRILKWTGITFLLLIILIIAAPFIFKDKIIALVKEEANKNLNAKVDFGEFDLTLISTFPDFHFVINNVSVIGVNEFEGDTLAFISQLSTNINLKSVIAGDKYQINSVVIDKARILGKVLSDGKANWDIAKPSADTTAAAPSEPTKFALKLKKLKISNTYIVYDDQQGSMYGKLEGFNYELAGDFTQDVFVMENLLEIAKTTFNMGGVGYLTNVHIKSKADLDMDMTAMKFKFKENEFSLNDLTLGFDGELSMPKDDIDMNITFKAKQTEFKSILSLIPSVYSKDFASVQTKGKLALNGYAKGTYNDKTYPAFGIDLSIADAMFKYPSLPKSVNNINIDVKVQNPTGVLDATTIDVNKFHMEMAGNPINMTAHIKTPISDPDIKAEIKALIVLASVKEFVPMEVGDEMNGTIKADIAMAGRLSAIEKQQYENFKASGALEIMQMKYKTASLPYEVLLNSMKLNFTNQFVELAGFDVKMGNTDLQANGKIENFLQYVFKDDLIKGAFNVTGNLIDLNQLMGPESTETAAATPSAAATSTAVASVVEVPGNIDFNLNAKFGKVLYTNLTLDNLTGNILVRDRKVDMTNLKMNTMGGGLGMSGYYETTNPKKPTANFNLDVTNFDIQNTFNTFNSIKKLAPIGQYAKGMFSAHIEDFKMALNDKMEPDLNTATCNGKLKTNKVSVGGYEPFNKLGDALKIKELKNLEFSNMDISFEMADGRVKTMPFDVKVNQINTNISGSTGLDQTIDYKWKMDIPRAMFGKEANTALTGLMAQANAAAGTNVSLGEKIKVTINFGGTVTNPTLKTGLKDDGGKSTTEAVKDQVVTAVADKANEEAQKILDDAKAQVEKIKAETQVQVDKMKAEGYANADKLVEEAKNPIAKIAAKKAAEVAKKEVDKQAQKVVDESEVRCQKILDDAKKKSEETANKNKK